jgi:hypothetical protein
MLCTACKSSNACGMLCAGANTTDPLIIALVRGELFGAFDVCEQNLSFGQSPFIYCSIDCFADTHGL